MIKTALTLLLLTVSISANASIGWFLVGMAVGGGSSNDTSISATTNSSGKFLIVEEDEECCSYPRGKIMVPASSFVYSIESVEGGTKCIEIGFRSTGGNRIELDVKGTTEDLQRKINKLYAKTEEDSE